MAVAAKPRPKKKAAPKAAATHNRRRKPKVVTKVVTRTRTLGARPASMGKDGFIMIILKGAAGYLAGNLVTNVAAGVLPDQIPKFVIPIAGAYLAVTQFKEPYIAAGMAAAAGKAISNQLSIPLLADPQEVVFADDDDDLVLLQDGTIITDEMGNSYMLADDGQSVLPFDPLQTNSPTLGDDNGIGMQTSAYSYDQPLNIY